MCGEGNMSARIIEPFDHVSLSIYHEGIEMLTVSGVRSPPLTPDMLTRQHKWVSDRLAPVDPDTVNISIPL